MSVTIYSAKVPVMDCDEEKENAETAQHESYTEMCWRINSRYGGDVSLSRFGAISNLTAIEDILVCFALKKAKSNSTYYTRLIRRHPTDILGDIFSEDLISPEWLFNLPLFADIFVQSYTCGRLSKLIPLLSREDNDAFASLRQWIEGDPIAHMAPMPDVDTPTLSIDAFIAELDKKDDAVYTRTCALPVVLRDHYGSLAAQLVEMVTELQNSVLALLAKIPEDVPATTVTVRVTNEFSKLLSRITDKVNRSLEVHFTALRINGEKIIRLCHVLLESHSLFHELLTNGEEGPRFPGSMADLQKHFHIFRDLFNSVKSCNAVDVTITVVGESNVGKTTFLGGLLGSSSCLPTSADPNSACPIRIEVDNSKPPEFRQFTIPSKFCHHLNHSLRCIRMAINQFRPCDVDIMPSCVKRGSPEADLFHRLASETELYAFQDTPITGDDLIHEAISHMNATIRLVYDLKACPRFSVRLKHVNPLHELEDGGDVVKGLPVLTAHCSSILNLQLPFMGTISIIDTPGVSEASFDETNFLHYSQSIMLAVLNRSDFVLNLTTSGLRSSFLSTKLRRQSQLLKQAGSMVVISKFDDEVGAAARYETFVGEHGAEGFQDVNVQIMAPGILFNVWNGSAYLECEGVIPSVADMGNASAELLNSDLDLTESIFEGNVYAGRLLDKIFGGFWRDEPVQLRSFISGRMRYLSKSNFDNVVRASVIPSVCRGIMIGPAKVVADQLSLLNRVHATVKAKLSVDKATLVALLQTLIVAIDVLLATEAASLEQYEDMLRASFVPIIETAIRQLENKVDEVVGNIEIESGVKSVDYTTVSETYMHPITRSPVTLNVQSNTTFDTAEMAEKVCKGTISQVNATVHQELQAFDKKLDDCRKDVLVEFINSLLKSVTDLCEHLTEKDPALLTIEEKRIAEMSKALGNIINKSKIFPPWSVTEQMSLHGKTNPRAVEDYKYSWFWRMLRYTEKESRVQFASIRRCFRDLLQWRRSPEFMTLCVDEGRSNVSNALTSVYNSLRENKKFFLRLQQILEDGALVENIATTTALDSRLADLKEQLLLLDISR